MPKNLSNKNRIITVVAVGMFSALAYVACALFHFKASFLTFDLKDAVMTTGAMIFGPASGFAMALIVSLIEALTISTTGYWGFLMNLASSAAFACTASIIYKRHRTMSGAVAAMAAASAVTVAVMIPANLIITPIFTGTSTAEVAAIVPTLLLPFNIAKVITNAAFVFILYSPISTAVRHAGFKLSEQPLRTKSGKRYIAVALGAASVAAAAITFFFLYLNGTVTIG